MSNPPLNATQSRVAVSDPDELLLELEADELEPEELEASLLDPDDKLLPELEPDEELPLLALEEVELFDEPLLDLDALLDEPDELLPELEEPLLEELPLEPEEDETKATVALKCLAFDFCPPATVEISCAFIPLLCFMSSPQYANQQ